MRIILNTFDISTAPIHIITNNSDISTDDSDSKHFKTITNEYDIKNVNIFTMPIDITNNSDTSINDSGSKNFKATINETDFKYADISTAPIVINSDSDSNIEDTSANSSVTYLNKMKNWKGKNNSPKKCGKYLTVCPDVENIHLKSKFTTSVSLLKNGSTLGPVIFGKKSTMLINTCPFDAIAQTLLVGYYDWTNFHRYVEETQNSMFQFIKELSTCELSTKIYKQRALILNKFIIPVNGTMNCAYNIFNLIS